mmetsp:Transcript_16556/g.42252  ORF Transcript_16556/g.42252 Transcript_16556/m.42252 type:complete len:258 (-) Transcript_16556:28-801(-)
MYWPAQIHGLSLTAVRGSGAGLRIGLFLIWPDSPRAPRGLPRPDRSCPLARPRTRLRFAQHKCRASPNTISAVRTRAARQQPTLRPRSEPVRSSNRSLFLRDADGAALASGRLSVLAAHAHAPVVPQTAVRADLLEALKVVAELEVEHVGARLRVLAVLVVLLPVEEPVRDLELARVLDDGHDTLHLLRRQLARALLEAHLGLLQHDVGEAAAHTRDAGHRKHHLLAAINVGVQHTQDVLEVRAGHHQRRTHGGERS